MSNPFRSLYVTTKRAVLNSLQRWLDEQITKRLKPYLAIGTAEDGTAMSEINVTPEGHIHITECVVLPSAVNDLLVAYELPFHVVMTHCDEVIIKIPWKNLTGGNWEISIVGLMVVFNTKERPDWSVDDLRRVKEAQIRSLHKSLLKRWQESQTKKKKLGLLAGLKSRFLAAMKPTVCIRDVHVRFERFASTMHNSLPFSLGFIITSCA